MKKKSLERQQKMYQESITNKIFTSTTTKIFIKYKSNLSITFDDIIY